MTQLEVPEVDYSRYTNRQLAAVPLAVLGLSLLILLASIPITGTPVALGIDFVGGSELTVETDAAESEVGDAFAVEPTSVQGVEGAEDTYVLRFKQTDVEGGLGDLRSQAQDAGMNVLSSATTSPSFGSGAQTTALVGLLVAFTGMSVLVFALFRTFVPSLAVVVSAFSDIVIPLGLMRVFGIELSLGTVAALLMIIGYSVDSDILLNNHVLRRSGGFYESVYRAMQTGVSMTVTSIAAMTVMALVASYYQIGLMADIGLILVFGLSADLLNTYMLNLSLLRWYKFEGVAR